MLHSFFSSILTGASNDAQLTRRRYPRRDSDRCICQLGGRVLPVDNWSFGGVLLCADERMFAFAQDVEMVLKFKLHNAIIDIKINGLVVRKDPGRIGIQFEPLTQTIRRNFQQVVDDQVAWEFATSQA